MQEHERVPLPYLLAALHRSEFTGRLGLLEGEVERTVVFHKGTPVQVQSRLQEETLGRILLEEGRITMDQYNRILGEMLATRKQAGEVLVSIGALGPQDVFAALEFQARKKLTNCFRMVGFDFAVLEGEVPPEMQIASLDTTEAILSGVLTNYSVDRLLGDFPVDEDTVFSRVSSPQERPAKIGPKENRILRSLGKGTPLASLMAGGIELQYLLSVLFTFHAMEMVEASGLTRPSRPELDLLRKAPSEPKLPEFAVEEPEPVEDIEAEEDFRPPTLASIMEGRIDSKLAEKTLSLGRQDHFALLGLDHSAKESAFETAYNRLLQSYKLENIDGSYAGEKERELALRLLDRATMAFRVLSDEESRAEYLKSLRAKEAAPDPRVPTRIRADVEALKALLAMRSDRWDEAAQLFEKAIELYPREPSYHFELGKLGYQRALAETPAGEPLDESLRKPFLKAMALDPRYDQPRLYLGYLAKRNGNLKVAIREFKGALDCNPKNRVAQSEFRMLKRRLREMEK